MTRAPKEIISLGQLALLMFQCVTGTSVLLMPSITTMLAGQAMWMTPLIGSFAGFLCIWMSFALQRLRPTEGFYAVMEQVLGKWPAKLTGLLFFGFLLHIGGATVRDYSEFISGNFFDQTPAIVIMLTMIAVTAYAVRGGVETIVRCAQIFVPVVVFFLLLNVMFLIPELKPYYILPLMGNGPLPLVKAGIVVQGWFCQFLLAGFFYRYVKDKSQIRRYGYGAVIATTLIMLICNLTVLLLLGNLAGKFNYPFLLASRYIRIADFFEHVESMVMMVWVLGAFIKLCVFYYASVSFYAEWMRIRQERERLLVLPVGWLILAFSFWVAPSMQTLSSFIGTSGTIYILTGFIGFPLLLTAVAFLRGKLTLSGRPRLQGGAGGDPEDPASPQ